MAFPEDYSGMRAEIFAGGRWINVIDTSDVRYESDVKITRGMRDAQTRASNTVCELVLDNRDGRYSPRNPISDLFGKIGNNTPLRIALPLITDAFGRTEVNGWGGPEVGGGGYTTAGAAASAFSVNSGEGHISLASLNNIQEAYLGSVLNRDVVVATDIYPNAIATGFAFDAGLTVRRTDASNYYSGRVIFYLSGIAFVEIYKHVAGVISQIATSVLETNDLFSYTASTQVRAEFIAVGSYLRIRAYDVGNPGTYAEASVNDSSLPYAGAIGVMCIMETGNTNSLPHVIDFDNFLRDDARCAVEIPSWPPRWDPTGTNIWVPINGHGVRDRLTQGAQALHSAYRRYVLQGGYSSEPDPVHYWPLEDSAGAQSAVDLFGDRPAHMLGTVSFASGDGPPGSASLPSISASGTPVNGLRYYVDRHSFELGDSWAWYLWMRGTGTDASCSPWVMSAEGSLPVWRLTVENTGTPTVVLNVYTRADIGTGDVLTMTCTVNANVLDGEWHLIVIEGFRVSDTNTQSFLTVDGDDPGSDFDTAVGFTSGSVSWSQTPSFVAMTNVDELQIGHVQFYAEETTVGAELEHVEAMQGWAGETAAARMQRLFEEEGIPFGLIGSADDTALVGPQRIATLMELADDCGDVDMGIGPYEAREFPGFIYRTRDNLYNQAPRVTLDYEAFDLFEVPEVTDDLQYVRNDITVTRDKGSSARSVLDDGSRLSISPPPTGIGTYDDPLTLTPHADSQLADLAGWLRHVKTNDEQRWPQLSLALERSPFTVDPVKTDSVRRSDLGDIAVIQNPPSFVTFDDVSLMFIGVTEILGRYKHQFNFNCTPSKPYPIGAVDTVSTQLHTAVNDSATSWKVSPVGLSTVDGYPHPRWSTVASDYPLDWMVAGERVTASTPPVNGTWSHIGTGTGASDANVAGNVTLAPALHASTAQNDLILLKASIRNSGTGVPNAPGTYTRLPIYPAASNVQIFAKKAGAGEGAPTVSFTGGVANATILAQTFTFRSSIGFFSVSGLVVHKAAILSGSAVDIPYPDCPAPEDNCLVLVSGWRQQDWTSVATLAGMTELSELDDGAGDNAGQVLDYVIQTSAANITGSVFSVTGGVAGISRGAVAFLRVDTQTATVVRSVNDVVKSQVANEEIALFNPAIVG